jgi:hypothetical protein
VELRIKAVNRAGDLTMTFAAIENYARPALKPFARYLNYGVSDPDKRQERGAALLNFVSLAAVFSNTGFAVIYLLIDRERYFPFITALLAFSLVWLLTPLLHRLERLPRAPICGLRPPWACRPMR